MCRHAAEVFSVNFVSGTVDVTRSEVVLPGPSYLAAIAKGFGARTVHIGTVADLDQILDDGLAYSGPTFPR